ncbi:MAG TPA: hypothetical protein PKA20_19625 [Burkholderiaceae bacterium]|nr:hypothetical protein [Burkholderiaceae bacterium]
MNEESLPKAAEDLRLQAGLSRCYGLVPFGRGVVVVLRDAEGAFLGRSEHLTTEDEAREFIAECVDLAPRLGAADAEKGELPLLACPPDEVRNRAF